VTNIDAKIEAVVIPIRLMISTPLTGGIHLGGVAIDLAAVLAVTADVDHDLRERRCRRGADWRECPPSLDSITYRHGQIHLSFQMTIRFNLTQHIQIAVGLMVLSDAKCTRPGKNFAVLIPWR
jgi:hypothetical protein